MNVKKITDVSPKSFFPIPKVKSTILLVEPKIKHYNLKNPKNLEYITNIFFNQKRKMIKKFTIIILLFCVVISCGKKGDPKYVDPDKKAEINEVSINLT